MLFDTLDFPEAVLAAQDAGELVIFAGAGISMGPPSRLPSFVELAETIAQRRLKPREKLQLDHFLGQLKTEGRDVHSLAVQALSRSDSLPTPVHEQLVRVFAKAEDVRIVTTNFDPHFKTVLSRTHPDVPVYAAPALPRGRDFHGLVHLHGATSGNPHDLVLTDSDFGRGYLTEGWARTFLEQLFARYHVLFVGYSHTDPPVHYIARGLPTEAQPRRFVITPEEPSRWRRLGISAIRFELGRGRRKFAAFTNGLTRWADVTRGSSFWLEDQVIQLLARPDPAALTEAEANLLEWCVTHDRTAPFFGRNARGLAWVDWLGSRRLLAPYFDRRSRFEHWHQRQLAVWLADQLLAGPHDRAFEIIRSQGGHFAADLHRWLMNQLGDRALPVAWTFLLAQETDPSDQQGHYMLGEKIRVFSMENLPAFWALFRAYTDPRVELDATGFGGPGTSAHSQIAISGDAAVIWSVWRESLQPRLHEFARPMLDLLLVQLERGIQLAVAVGTEKDFNRYATGGRSRIARIEHDHHRESRPDVLVDMVVQIISHLTGTAGGLPEREIRGWLDSARGIFRRFGLHALEGSVDLGAPTKATWARECAARYAADSAEQREAAALVTRLTTPLERDRMPAAITVPPVSETLPPLAELLAMESRRLGRTVMTTRLTPSTVFARLRELEAATSRDSGLAAHELWDLLLGRINWRQLDSAERDALIAMLRLPAVMAHRARIVLRCLFHQDPLENDAQGGHSPATPEQATQLFVLSRDVWENVRDEPVPATEDFAEADWISLALNDGIGTYHLVRFWMQFVSLQPHDAARPALPAEVAAIFEDICTRATEVARRARAVLIQDMRFVMARDPGWTTANMVPLFDFSVAGEEAWVAWRPFLDHGRFSRPLALALLPHYRAAQERLLATDEKVVGEFLQDVASIVVHVRPAESGSWMRALLPALPPAERLRWARFVGREMEGMPNEAQRELWQVWLRDYWADRRNGRVGTETMPLSGRETAAMVGWLPALPEVFAEALELVRASPAPDFAEETFPWRELRKSSLPERHAVAFLGFLEFLLAHMESNRIHHESITEAAARLPRLAVMREPLLRIAEVFHQHSWMGSRDFRAWVLREFPELTEA